MYHSLKVVREIRENSKCIPIFSKLFVSQSVVVMTTAMLCFIKMPW